MHRTQIYLPDDLHERLKSRSRVDGLSMTELIRRAVEKELQRESSISDARHFFEEMTPLESFASCEPEQYVRSIRDTSRILRNEQDEDA
jgi:predicted DNA-binding protein